MPAAHTAPGMPPSPPKPGCGTAPGRIQHTLLADFRLTVRRSRSFASPLVVLVVSPCRSSFSWFRLAARRLRSPPPSRRSDTPPTVTTRRAARSARCSRTQRGETSPGRSASATAASTWITSTGGSGRRPMATRSGPRSRPRRDRDRPRKGESSSKFRTPTGSTGLIAPRQVARDCRPGRDHERDHDALSQTEDEDQHRGGADPGQGRGEAATTRSTPPVRTQTPKRSASPSP